MKKKITIEDKIKYLGGSLDGKLVRPSIANEALKYKINIIKFYQIDGADYPMGMRESYEATEIDGQLVFMLADQNKFEINI